MPGFSADLLLWSMFCSIKSHCVFYSEMSSLFELNFWQDSAVTFHRNRGKLKNEGEKVMQEAYAWILVLVCKKFALGHDKRYEKFPKALIKKLSFLQQRNTTQQQEALFSVVSMLLNLNLIAACNLYHCTTPLFSCPPSSDTLYSYFVPSVENSTLVPNPNLFSLSAPHAHNLSGFSLFIQVLLWFLWPSFLVS